MTIKYFSKFESLKEKLAIKIIFISRKKTATSERLVAMQLSDKLDFFLGSENHKWGKTLRFYLHPWRRMDIL